MADLSLLYGKGFQYPFAWTEGEGGVERAEAVDSVRASLYRLFDTAPGEQFMLPDYGCALKLLIFEQDTDVFRALCEVAIREAVGRWEPRIAEVVDITIDRDDVLTPNQIDIQVFFRLINTQSVYNMVYPFTLG